MAESIILVGHTNQAEANIASEERKFIKDEYLIIEDENLGDVLIEVVETNSFPKVDELTFSPKTVILSSLRNNGFNLEQPIHIAKVVILDDIEVPLTVNSKVRIPKFSEIEHLLMKKRPEDGFTLGVIRGTKDLYRSLPEDLNNIAPLFQPGKGIIKQDEVPFIFDYYSFREYPHIGLFGGSGSGKSFGLRVFGEEILEKKIPGIISDPHKEFTFSEPMPGIAKEFQRDYSSRFEIFEVGRDVGISFPDIRTEELCTMLEYSGKMMDPMINAVKTLHQPKDSETTFLNRLERLIRAFENEEQPKRDRDDLDDDTVLLFQKYRNSLAGASTLRAVAWRFQSLCNEGIFRKDTNGVERCLLNRKLAVIQGNIRLINILAGYLVNKMYKKRRAFKDWQFRGSDQNVKMVPDKFPPFFVIIDEAHNFAPQGEYGSPTKRIIKEISQEGRKYGVFLVLATQRPALLDTTIVAQLNTKVIFRTQIQADMEMIKAESNLTPIEVQRLPQLSSGSAFISSATLPKTFFIRFRSSRTISPHALHPFDELDEYNSEDKLRKILIKMLPLSGLTVQEHHAEINEKAGRNLDVKEIFNLLEEMAKEHLIIKEFSPMGPLFSTK